MFFRELESNWREKNPSPYSDAKSKALGYTLEFGVERLGQTESAMVANLEPHQPK